MALLLFAIGFESGGMKEGSAARPRRSNRAAPPEAGGWMREDRPMHVIVKGHHIHVSDTLKETAVHKLEKLTRFFDRIQKLEIEFAHEKSLRGPAKHRVDVLLTTPLGPLRAHANATDPEAAVDGVVDKLERQVKRMKERVAHHDKGGLRARAISPRLNPA